MSQKLTQLRGIMRENNYGALEINSQSNFSWLTRGRGFIGLAAVAACGSIIVTPEKAYLVTENIEAERLYEEELLNNPDIEVRPVPWNKPSARAEVIASIIGNGKLAGESDIAPQLFALRTLMSDYDMEDYRSLCLETARILESTVKGLIKGVSGFELAGELSKRFWSAGIEPITILNAFDERALSRRHPLPCSEKLENYALTVVCARRGGLIASATRNILISDNAEMIRRHEKCAMVDAVATSLLQPGVNLGDIFESMVHEYAQQGFPGEYLFHHQGGLTGFMPREIRANSSAQHIVRANEVYAFNPSIQGAKCEDTVAVTASGVETMTYTGEYAYINCKVNDISIKKPTVLVLN